METKRLLIAALLAGTFFSASAQEGTALLTGCVDLGADQEVVRNGSSGKFLLRDADAYYRISFRGTCSSITTSPTVSVSTDGTAGRLCPQGSKVQTRRDICGVESVELIDADQFARLKKRAAR